MGGPAFLFLDGNVAWLDFVNTELIDDGRPADRLERFEDLVEWLRLAELIDDAHAAEALRLWAGHAQGRETLLRAKELRKALREAAARMEADGQLPAPALRAVNDALARSPGALRLVSRKQGYRVAFDAPPRRAEELLGPLAKSVAEFVAGADLRRVKKCGNPDCVLYFYDTTKNQHRRWCRMAVCGNRMKAAAHYRRLKKGR